MENMFICKAKNNKTVFIIPVLFKISLGVLTYIIRQEKKSSSIRIKNKEVRSISVCKWYDCM